MIRTVFLAAVAALAAWTSAPAARANDASASVDTRPRPSVPGFSRLTFNSDFDRGLDKAVWRVRKDMEGSVLYRPDRVSVHNGVLTIQGAPMFWRRGKFFGGGLVAQKVKIGPGRLVEFRMRLEGAQRWNLAGWTFGGDPWPKNGEIDTVELISRPNGRAFPLQSVHGPTRGLLGNNAGADLELDGGAWRTYAHLWQDDTVIFYIDGRETWRYRLTDPHAIEAFKTFFPVISFYSGGWVGVSPGRATAYIDFVRVWEP